MIYFPAVLPGTGKYEEVKILKPYEAVMIFNRELPDEKLNLVLGKIEKKIKDNGGTEIKLTKWGAKRIAYPMKRAKGATEGSYVLVNFQGESGTPNELMSLLKVTEDIIRYSVICSKPAEEEKEEEKVEIEPSMMLAPEEASK